VKIIKWGISQDELLSVAKACEVLEINPRAYYRCYDEKPRRYSHSSKKTKR
jgi:hypothetical protein